ncbi:Sto1 protein [Pichia kluyveri]|uniref:Sto1 protein n=1 Tax=Pichia kluyveri TaxID=36015 RepID=A0AAV5R4Z3_PICKL|nr:Sto1 protein [Pichia kluyveri]
MSDDRSRKRGRSDEDDGYYPSNEFSGEYPPPNGDYPPQEGYNNNNNQGYNQNNYQGNYQGNYRGGYQGGHYGGYQNRYQNRYQGGYQNNYGGNNNGYNNYPPPQLQQHQLPPQQQQPPVYEHKYNQYNQGQPPVGDYNQGNMYNQGFQPQQQQAPPYADAPQAYASGTNNIPVGAPMPVQAPVRESFAGIGGRNNKREYYQPQEEFNKVTELCSRLEFLGDSAFETKMLLTQSSETLAFCWNDLEFKKKLLQYLGAVIYEMPHKSVIFSGLILLSNSKNGDVGKDFIDWLKHRIDEVFNAMVEDSNDNFTSKSEMAHLKSWNVIVTLLRMIGLLSSIIVDFDEIITFTNKLIEFAIELQNNNENRSGLAELIFYEVVIGIPFYLVNDQSNVELKNKLRELINNASKFQVKDGECEFDDDYYKPINSNNGSIVKMSDILRNVCEATESYLDDMSLFMDVASFVDPLIETVLVERGIKIAKVEAERKKAAGETEEKKENDEVNKEQDNDDDYKPNEGEKMDDDDKPKEETNEDEKLEIEEQFVSKHSIGEIEVPSYEVLNRYQDFSKFASDVDKIWLHPRYFINLFPFESTRQQLELETSPSLNSYISMILNDDIINVLFKLEYNRITCSKHLLNFQAYYNHKKFAKPNSPLDKLLIIKDLNKGIDFDLIKNLEESTDFEEEAKQQMINSAKKIQEEYEKGFTSTWKMEEIVLKNIINLAFLLPDSSLTLLYFESLIADTCGRNWTLSKRNANNVGGNNNNDILIFSKLVGDIFRYFYNNVEELEFVNINKFINWFLFQISNFKFEWAWEEWVNNINELGEAEQNYNARIYFIKNVIHKELLINNYKFIKNNTLPKEFQRYANLSLKTKEELIEYDIKFFGKSFADNNTINPFDSIEGENGNGLDDNELNKNYEHYSTEAIVETNTETFKLFDNYLFNHDEHPYNENCRDIYMNLENIEASIELFEELINKLRERVENESEESKIVENSDEYIITVIIQSICLIGSRSFSVFEESLKKVFGEKLKFVLDSIDNDMKEEWIIEAVLRIWNNEPRIGLLFIEKLNKFGVLDTFTIIRKVWNLSSDRLLPLSELYVSEFLENLIEGEIYYEEDESDDTDSNANEGENEEEEEYVEKVNEESFEKYKDTIKFNFEIAIEKMNEMYIEVENGLAIKDLKTLKAGDEDYKWGVKNMFGLLKKYIFKYGKDIGNEGEIENILSGLDNEEIRNELIRLNKQLLV